MRSDQYIGLCDRAQQWLTKNCQQVQKTVQIVRVGVAADGQEPDVSTNQSLDLYRQPYHNIHGAWTDVVATLDVYVTHDQRPVYEFVQAEIWDSGPMYFIGLAWERLGEDPIQETLWSPDELQ